MFSIMVSVHIPLSMIVDKAKDLGIDLSDEELDKLQQAIEAEAESTAEDHIHTQMENLHVHYIQRILNEGKHENSSN